MTRREFLKRMGLLGGGIVVYMSVGDPSSWAEQPADFNAFLRVGADGRIACFTGKIEMGQGIITSLAQMRADELFVPLASVDMVMGDTRVCPYNRGTFGSLTTKYFGATLRQAAAEARAVLIQMAAEKLNAPPHQLNVHDGQVIDSLNTNRRVTYAELTEGKIVERRLKQSVSPLPAYRHTLSGKATGRTDARQKVTGEARFTGDIRLPGMLYAKILRPPAEIITQSGSMEAGLNFAAHTFESVYLNHYVAHAPMEPHTAVVQIEDCVTMGLGYVLREEIRFRGGKILDENFDTYELPRFSWLPKIETLLRKWPSHSSCTPCEPF